MEEKYQITLTKKQLELLSEITEKYARLIVGQLDYAIEDELKKAARKHITDGKFSDEYFRISEIIEQELNYLRKMCWNQNPNQFYGVKYSEKSDTLFDMHEVIRHFLYLKRGDTSRMTVDSDKPFHWSKTEPLIEVEKI